MSYISFESRYDRMPVTEIEGHDGSACKGWKAISEAVRKLSETEELLLVDCYPGVHDDEILDNIEKAFAPEVTIKMEDIFIDGEEITEKIKDTLTDDRVRGRMYFGTVMDFLDRGKLADARKWVRFYEGKILVYGFGASLLSDRGTVIYADMTRWEIQLRYRDGMPNYLQKNYNEDILRKYKRGYFFEWRIADRHKAGVLDRIDYYLDTNRKDDPSMVTGEAFRKGLQTMTERPFRLVPYFDPGVWGGQWMKEVCHLDKDEKNFAWSFDGVPEENSIIMRFGSVDIESPAMNMTLYRPRQFIGEKNFSRFGAEFPIRLDLLDTMGGQNLSLQVHPDTEYIHRKFGMSYTQDESYYILDAGEGAGVYLGIRTGTDSKEMIDALEEAQKGEHGFDAEKYVNFIPAKKHDHFLIPAGTVHCSSRNCMVLEVSATPYIFTFKLWDWDRVGLDGLPRPIHIEDGKQVIRFDRDTEWVMDNLVNRSEPVEECENYSAVRTGLHELEFIETLVYTIRDHVDIPSDREVAVYNLVEGQAAVIESTEGWFAPFEVHYAETFIVPAEAGDIRIRPEGSYDVKVLRASVRN
ncbi:MAG: class I mannose-6-phosphate isomerase [Clostridia bacterium]|nr:class I mannose-6-phosphate isomerase [Clostridia bacterium]